MKFYADDDQLTVTLEGSEVFFGLKRRLVIPRSQILDLKWQPELYFTERIWRLLGAGIPGVLYAGRFRGSSQNYFLFLRRPRGISWAGRAIQAENVLVVTTDNYPYRQILLTCQPDIGAKLMAWYRNSAAVQSAE